ncbi:hypothetical protein HMPREF1990_01763 [Porphyromonas gingivalis W4087]|uniref:Uncharacterized protein n=1 Tax=Porphyromonas gingivalis F0570 TaxID=1227271 RepID=A0A0E2M4R2_PORGN|nr:hypothetical protein HMPREF1555_01421 [Porphyromonas gingivalis F0570]ERJ87510.1 hypothetical protein HMPREF1990_01763 [Porphyromonas gingivalis W4087]
MVVVVNDHIDAGKAYHLVQLIATLIDDAIAGHKNAHLVASLLNGLRQFARNDRYVRFRQVGENFLGYVKNFFGIHSFTVIYVSCKGTKKTHRQDKEEVRKALLDKYKKTKYLKNRTAKAAINKLPKPDLNGGDQSANRETNHSRMST